MFSDFVRAMSGMVVPRAAEADCAGKTEKSRSGHARNGLKFNDLVAGTGFEPVTFRL
jgi:hypothetical protein